MTATRLANFIGGARAEPVDPTGVTSVFDPSTGETYAEAPVSGRADLDAAFAAAAAASPQWSDATPGQRSRALLRVADTLESRAAELVAEECRNTGKPRRSMQVDEMPHILDVVRFFAGAARMLEGRSAGQYVAGHTSSVRREALGVVAQITPWNYPLMMATWKWAPALAAGNTVVLKPAETTPAAPLLMAELLAEHLPPGVFNVVCGDRATGAAMAAHPVPAMVSVTGSVATGRSVMAAAAAGPKRVHLELGGNAPVVVFDDADLDTVVPRITSAAYFNAGQSCTAASRVLAGPRIHDRLVDALAAAAVATRVGAPDEGAYHGPLNNPVQLARVAGLVDRRGTGTDILAGGRPLDRPGYFYPPTVVAGVRPEDELAGAEIFGPVVTVSRFGDEDEAVAWANGTEYALGSSVWTTDHARAERVARRLDAGTVWINCHSVLAAEMPHGGTRGSGFGTDLSAYSMEEYTRVKHVMARFDR
ncbi:MAG: aminobutyraldehyde dehydrogenase [Actinomycetota bacterium]|nr:aminobutyraldehyde dehydrogenase [Actinomycetota bacterium]